MLYHEIPLQGLELVVLGLGLRVVALHQMTVGGQELFQSAGTIAAGALKLTNAVLPVLIRETS